MAELKTKQTSASVKKFLDSIPDDEKRKDAYTIVELMRRTTNAEPKMWGTSIVGFGNYHYKYASGREGAAPLIGFSPRKQNLTLYIMSGFEQYATLMESLGKYTTGKACLYVKRLDDIHLPTLRKLIQQSVKYVSKKNS